MPLQTRHDYCLLSSSIAEYDELSSWFMSLCTSPRSQSALHFPYHGGMCPSVLFLLCGSVAILIVDVLIRM